MYRAYEKQVRAEIEAWKNERKGIVTRALDYVGKPIDWIYDVVIPDSANAIVSQTVSRFFGGLKDISYWTYSDAEILGEAEKQGIRVNDISDLKDQPLELQDRVARSYFTSNKLVAALEGAGCGLGGAALIAADIPLLFTISFRAVQQIGSSYGYNMKDPDMLPIILGIFNTASAPSGEAKSDALDGMTAAAKFISENWAFKQAAETTQTGILVALLKDQIRRLPQEIANNITKRKMGQLIPVVGAVIGAGFNYWFLSAVTKAAYMIFRELTLNRIEEKRSVEDAQAVEQVSSKKKAAAAKKSTVKKCKAKTKKGTKCTRNAVADGYCKLHSKK